MAASNLNLGKASGGVLNIQPADGTTTTSLVLPAINGTVVAADSNGNVGIGVTPYSSTGIGKSIDINTNGAISADTVGVNITNNQYYSNGWKYKLSGYALQYEQNLTTGVHRWYNSTSGTAGGTVSPITAMTLDANGNVGIGTSSPAYILDAKVDTGSSALHLQTNGLGGCDVLVQATRSGPAVIGVGSSNGSLAFATGTGSGATATERMRIDSNGNLGIGITPSAWSAYKVIQTGYSGVLSGSNSANELTIGSNFYNSSAGWKYINNGYASQQQFVNGTVYWNVAPSGTAGNAITWTNAMTLDANNNLSLGFGNLLINNLSASSGNTVVMYGANKTNYIQLVGRDTINTDGVLLSYMGSVLKSAILANGSFLSATNSYGSTSDAKLKENVQDASPKLDKLMQVQVRTFNYIGQEDKQIGVVAQEIEKIFPSIVYETKDTKQVEVEKEREITLEDGTVDVETYTEMETVETGETTKNVKYSVIYMMMLKAMQEQNEIIKDLKSRIEILEAK